MKVGLHVCKCEGNSNSEARRSRDSKGRWVKIPGVTQPWKWPVHKKSQEEGKGRVGQMEMSVRWKRGRPVRRFRDVV